MRELDVASASGVARRGDRIFVIADDLRELAVYRLSRPNEPGERRTVLAERDGAGKPDVECLTLLPPFEEAPHGCLLGLGSGSEPDRNRGFAWVLAPDGDLAGAPVELDLTPLWDLLREHAGALNVEGDRERRRQAVDLQSSATPRRGATWSPKSHSKTSSDPFGATTAWTAASSARSARTTSARSRACRSPSRTRSASLADELVVFTASAESDDGDGPDGSIRGSVVGTLDATGEGAPPAHHRPPVEGRRRLRRDRCGRGRPHVRLRSGRPGHPCRLCSSPDASGSALGL